MKSIFEGDKVLVLNDIRSMENVGSLMRTADAAGIRYIYMCGITPTPIDRFGRTVKAIQKAALGAEETIKWEKCEDPIELLNNLKRAGFQIVSIEQSDTSVDYKDIKLSGKIAFVLGNEVGGISPEILKLSDYIAEIPMQGKKESLNVAVAGGIAIFRILGI